jgi:hypothetical protein
LIGPKWYLIAISAHVFFAQGRLGCQIVENLECTNDSADLGDRIEKDIWERMSQRENRPEKEETSVTFLLAPK